MERDVKPRRPYRSPARRRQAAATRARVAAAARRLFVERGYAATTVEAIARAAGVAVPTLYAAVGGKRAVLWALLEAMARDVGVPDRYDLVVAEPDPVRRLQLV